MGTRSRREPLAPEEGANPARNLSPSSAAAARDPKGKAARCGGQGIKPSTYEPTKMGSSLRPREPEHRHTPPLLFRLPQYETIPAGCDRGSAREGGNLGRGTRSRRFIRVHRNRQTPPCVGEDFGRPSC